MLPCVALAMIFAGAWPAGAWAEGPAGTVTHVKGEAEVGIDGQWHALDLGAEVPVGGRLRTGATAELRVVFRDDAVLNLQQRSEVVVERQVIDPDAGRYEAALTLVRGSIYVHVSDHAGAPSAKFLVTSPTASASLTGGDFAFEYDALTDATSIAGLPGQGNVASILLPHEKGVLITARQATRVARNKPPEPVNVVDSTLFEQYRDTVTRAGSDWPLLVWQHNALVSGLAVARGADARSVLSEPSPPTSPPKSRRSSVSSGQDVGSLLGESPAALSSGGLKFGVQFFPR